MTTFAQADRKLIVLDLSAEISGEPHAKDTKPIKLPDRDAADGAKLGVDATAFLFDLPHVREEVRGASSVMKLLKARSAPSTFPNSAC